MLKVDIFKIITRLVIVLVQAKTRDGLRYNALLSQYEIVGAHEEMLLGPLIRFQLSPVRRQRRA